MIFGKPVKGTVNSSSGGGIDDNSEVLILNAGIC